VALSDFHGLVPLEPLLQALQMDSTHRPRAVAGRDHRVEGFVRYVHVAVAVVIKTDSTDHGRFLRNTTKVALFSILIQKFAVLGKILHALGTLVLLLRLSLVQLQGLKLVVRALSVGVDRLN